MSLFQVNLMHTIIVGPLFYSIGVNKDITNWKITSLTTLMILIPFIVRIPKKKMKKNRKLTNYFHFALLLVYLIFLYKKKEILENKELLKNILDISKLLGIIVILTHIYKLSLY